MGYTHYYYQKPELDAQKFKDFSEKVAILLDNNDARSLLAWAYDQVNKPPEITDTVIRFNGKGADGHETFMLSRDMSAEPNGHGKVFSFCKTAQKPYDKYVTACLIIAKSVFDKDIDITSDGSPEEWQEGKGLAEKVLNAKITIHNKGFTMKFKEKRPTLVTEEEYIEDIRK